MTDDELVSGFLGGDRSAFTRLMERHEDRVYALAHRLTGNRQDAPDATQEVFLQLLRKLDRYDQKSAFSTWLYRVAHNLARNAQTAFRTSKTDSLPDVVVAGELPAQVASAES